MLIIDRFEGSYAVVEAGDEMVNIPRSLLPIGAKEGDSLRLVIDEDDTAARVIRIEEKMNKLFKD
jgi:hypothetical protein